MPSYRPDVEAVVDPAPGSRPVASLLANEVRVSCPACGSPYIATFDLSETRTKGLTSFVCFAGDCKYTGTIPR